MATGKIEEIPKRRVKATFGAKKKRALLATKKKGWLQEANDEITTRKISKACKERKR